MKNPLTPAGIEPATFRFVAQSLNHCATAVPLRLICEWEIIFGYDYTASWTRRPQRKYETLFLILIIKPTRRTNLSDFILFFYPKNESEKLVRLVGFIIRFYHDARSPER